MYKTKIEIVKKQLCVCCRPNEIKANWIEAKTDNQVIDCLVEQNKRKLRERGINIKTPIEDDEDKEEERGGWQKVK